MSQKNVELVCELLELFAHRQHERVFELYDPEIEWDASGRRCRQRRGKAARAATFGRGTCYTGRRRVTGRIDDTQAGA